jgi:tRNA G18 (ribose-2'-O)-methylase SpoU
LNVQPYDPLASEWQPYRGLYGAKDILHPEAGPCFICEGRYLVHEALKAARDGSLEVLSVLTTPRSVHEFEELLPAGTILLLAEDALLEQVLGFAFHRGVLCCVKRPPAPPAERLLAARQLVVLPRLDNVDNLGQILRTAAALGMDGVLMDRGPGPFERRTVRVSMGAAWRIPILQTPELEDWLERWRRFAPGEVVGAALTASAMDARLWAPAPRTALVLGPEDKGLDPAWLDRCDRQVIIPMARAMDSLNVAAAGAILMHCMTTARLPVGAE